MIGSSSLRNVERGNNSGRILEERVIPWANKRYVAMNCVLVQDNASCHVGKKTVSWITPKINFWHKGVLHSSSLDLNVWDYAVFAHLQRAVNKNPYNSTDLLLRSIKKACDCVKNMVSTLRHRVKVIATERGHTRTVFTYRRNFVPLYVHRYIP